MTFYGQFQNINGKIWNVEISTAAEGGNEEVEILFGDNPCEMTTSSNSLFAPIKSRSLTIQIFTKRYYFDLYQPASRGAKVKIYDDERTVFSGYVKPSVYQQDWTYADVIEVDCVDGISTAKDFDWKGAGGTDRFIDIILSILSPCGYRGDLYVPEVYGADNGLINGRILDNISISGSNFIDDDAASTPWTQYEVMEEICKFMGWTLVPDGEDVWLVDYRAENKGATKYIKYDIQTGADKGSYISDTAPVDITVDMMAPGTSSIEIDDIYNKIEISDNLYEIKNITPDIFEDEAHISVTDEMNLSSANTKWTKTETKKFLWWTTSSKTSITGYDYQTICRLDEKSGWKHRYYRHRDLTELDNTDGKGYYDKGSTSIYTADLTNKYINTHGCLIQHYAHQNNEGQNNIPANIDWDTIMTFFVTDDTTPNYDIKTVEKFELPVLEYTTGESVTWKPNSGTSWIFIKGDLWYQCHGDKYGNKNKQNLQLINESGRLYITYPVDKAVNIDEREYCLWGGRTPSNKDYGKGFEMWKMRLQIGDKYWDGDKWVTTPVDFKINYNNNPDGSKNEYTVAYGWMNTVNNKTYKDKVGEDAYCIPIAADDPAAPVTGVMKLTVYTPTIMPPGLLEFFNILFPNSYLDISWKDLPYCIYCKNFEIGYVYTDTSVWYKQHSDEQKEDKLYVGYINDDYVNSLDTIEFRINTASADMPISRSYVATERGMLKNMKHSAGDEYKVQEYNVVDLYLDHYSDRKVIWKQNLHGYSRPNAKYVNKEFNGTLMVDTQSYDFRLDNNSMKLIAF